MGFEELLGNERLKENLTGSLRRGHISHFYLICGPEGSGKHTLAQLLAAAILCGKPDARLDSHGYQPRRYGGAFVCAHARFRHNVPCSKS